MNRRSRHGPRRPHIRSIALLLAFFVLVAISVIPFASGDQTYAASSAPEYTHLVVSLIRPENPVYIAPNTLLSLEALVTTYGPNETIAKVEFYFSNDAGGSAPTLIGTDQGASSNMTYNMTWTPSVPGGYSLTAKAYDTLGNVATSASVTATVAVGTPPLQPPPEVIITITSPSNGVYTLPAQIPLTVRLDNDLEGGTLAFYVALAPNRPTTLVGTVPSPADSVTWVPTQAGRSR